MYISDKNRGKNLSVHFYGSKPVQLHKAIPSSAANYAMVSHAGLLTRIGGADGPRLVLRLNIAVTLLGILLAFSLNRMQKRETAQSTN